MDMADNEQPAKPKAMQIIPLVILVIIGGLIALNYAGYIDLSKIAQSYNEYSSSSKFNPNFRNDSAIPPGKCPVTSCDTKVCCHSTEYDPSIETNATVYAVITYERCDCPNDTNPTPVGIDTQTPGGPYKICECK